MNSAIVLIGPMGSGKSTLGKKLAKDLELEFIDTDKVIAKEHGAITKIFETQGEAHFRKLETEALKRALSSNAIVATGGGAVMSEENQALIAQHHVVFLDTAAEHVLDKINLKKRPLLKDNPQRWQEIYDQRKATYEKLANQTIFTGGRGIKGLLKEIKEGLPK